MKIQRPNLIDAKQRFALAWVKEHESQSDEDTATALLLLLDTHSRVDTAQYKELRTLRALTFGIESVRNLLTKLAGDNAFVGHADFGPGAATVEERAALLLRTLDGGVDITDELL